VTLATAVVVPGPAEPLRIEKRSLGAPAGAQVVIGIEACAVCRTDLHVLDGELPQARYPIVPGHQAIGRVLSAGPEARFQPGDWVGVNWLAWTCGACEFCSSQRENLCPRALFHGCHVDGGFATHMLADSRYCLALPAAHRAAGAAPLLCAGIIGYRSLRMAGRGLRLGIYGFGSAGHLIAQFARHEGRDVYAFTRPGDTRAQDFARASGASWAGDSTAAPPVALDSAIIFAPDGALVPRALKAVKPGGRVVCGGIHMSDIPSFPYADLWEERQILSVANLTRDDGREFFESAGLNKLQARITRYRLADAGTALEDLRHGRFEGTAVLMCGGA
jgi:propanol-preferring alcohol dehydrogenase